ncbi:MAG: hypothetical protein E6I56_11895 [Chloroflexi bacterium]|nr:MAG: hypothetical protein E6I56_11895 [Chloroflexota bacterium]
MSRRLIAALVLTAAVFTACGRPSSAVPPAGDYRLFLVEGDGNGAQLTVRDAAKGTLERVLPLGVPAPDWSRYYTVSATSTTGRLSAVDPATGRAVAQLAIPSGFTLPTLTYPQLPGGISPNGAWLTLSMQTFAGGARHSDFLVGPSSLARPFTRLSLTGDFSFDAISNDGQNLYLIETMGDPGHYQVRLYNVASRNLVEQPIFDKREPNEPMNGIRGDSVFTPDGNFVLTVYARDSGPFIHALPLGQPYAWCVDLPSSQASNMEEQFQWSITSNRDGSSVYAVNAVTGRISEITPARLPDVHRTGQVSLIAAPAPLVAGLFTDAEAKGVHVNGAALSADGQTLFALDNAGIVAIDTATLKTRARYLGGGAVMSIRMSTDGRWLFAADVETEQIFKLDPRTGKVAAHVAGLANPWAILWAEPK